MHNRFFFLFVCFAGIISGCVRVNTSPCDEFGCIAHEAYDRTGQCVSWGGSAEIDELLAQELDVETAVRIALLNNRHLQSVYQELGIAKAELVQAGLLTNPIFVLSYRFTVGAMISDLINMSLLHNFLEALLIPLKKRMACAELEATKNRILGEILELVAQTKVAFFALQAQDQFVTYSRELLLASDATYDAASRMYRAGNLTELELVEKEALFNQAQIELSSAELELQGMKERLNVLMGLNGCEISWCYSNCLPSLPSEDCDWNMIEECAISNSLDLARARSLIYATAAGMGADVIRQVFPQIEAGPDSEREDGVWFVGPAIAIAIPFFDFGKARKAAARAEVFRQYELFLDLGIQIRSQARKAKLRLLTAYWQSCYYTQQIVPISEQRTYLTLEQYNAMQLGVFELLMTKQSEIMKKMEAVRHLADYWRALTEIETLYNGHLLHRL